MICVPPCLPICIAAGAFLVFNGRLSVGALVSFHVLFVSVSQSVIPRKGQSLSMGWISGQ